MVETQRAMKKVVCPACGLVNLEKFVTYPHCAGCGTVLLMVASVSPTSFWKQPLRAPMWATVIALCCTAVGILGIAIARETGHIAERQLTVYAQMPRQITAKRPATVRLVLDSVAGDSETNLSEFEFVELRVPKRVEENFSIVSITPLPDRMVASRLGTVFEFDKLQRDNPIHLLLLARRPGSHRLIFSLFVNNFTPFHFRRTVPVVAQNVYPSIGSPKAKKTSQVAQKIQIRGEN
jgi:hypothetical protein